MFYSNGRKIYGTKSSALHIKGDVYSSGLRRKKPTQKQRKARAAKRKAEAKGRDSETSAPTFICEDIITFARTHYEH